MPKIDKKSATMVIIALAIAMVVAVKLIKHTAVKPVDPVAARLQG